MGVGERILGDFLYYKGNFSNVNSVIPSIDSVFASK